MFWRRFDPVSPDRCLNNGVDQAGVKAQHSLGNSELWMSRPLPPSFLTYAAYDIVLLKLILAEMNQRLPNGLTTDVRNESQRYAELRRNARSNRDSQWHNHGLLPQGIIDSCDASQRTKMHSSGTRQCPGCQYNLHQCSFLFSQISQWRQQSFHQKLCFTCFSVSQSNNTVKTSPKKPSNSRSHFNVYDDWHLFGDEIEQEDLISDEPQENDYGFQFDF